MTTLQLTKQDKSRLWLIASFFFVVLSGLALSRLGYAENPFDTIEAAIEIRQLEQANDDLNLPAPTFADSAETDIEIIFPDQQVGKTSDWHITWSAFGDVLFDLWFICAAILFIIFIRHPIGWLVKQIQPSRTKK